MPTPAPRDGALRDGALRDGASRDGVAREGERPLVGRDQLLSDVVARLRAGTPLMLHGPAGVGKTLLARWAADQIVASDRERALWVQGTPGLATVPLGALAPSLEGAVRSAGDAAAVAVRLIDGLGATPPVCVVDDLQWVDDLSIGVVQQLALGHDVAVLATTRADEPLSPAATAFLRATAAVTVEVAPLDADGVAGLLAGLLDGPIDRKLARAVTERSGGNPLFVTELAAGGTAAGVLVAVDGVWTLAGDLVPSRVLRDVVAARFAGLDPAVVEAAEVLAVAEHLGLDHGVRCLGEDRLTELERAGLLHEREAGGHLLVELGHPVYGEVLRAGIGPLARRRHCRVLAESLVADREPADLGDDDLVRLARWRLASGTALEPTVAAEAARVAHGRFDYDLALDLARRSFDAEPTAGAGLLLAELLHIRGRHDEAHEVLARVLTLDSDEQERATIVGITALSALHGEGDVTGARTMLDEALATTTDPASRLALLTAAVYVPLMAEAFDELPTRLDALTGEFPPSTTVASRQLVTGAYVVLGRECEAVDLIVEPPIREDDLFVRAADLRNMSGGLQALALVRTGALAEADAVGRDSHDACTAAGDGRSQAMAAFSLSLAAFERGDPHEAMSWALDAQRALDGILAPNLACAAVSALLLAAAEAGDLATVARAEEALDAFVASPDRLYVAVGERGRGVAIGARGLDRAAGARAAAAHLTGLARHHADLGAHGYAVDLWHESFRFVPPTRAAAAAIRASVVPRAGRHAELRAAHAEAWIGADLDGLVGVADELIGLGCRRDALLVLARATELAAEQGFDRRAKELRYRTDAERAASGSGAGGSGFGRGSASGSASGRDPGVGAASGASGRVGTVASVWALLTEREADIGRRAASGHPSKRIAADLGISRRTVDNALQRVFTKLGVSSRGDLIDLVPSESESTPGSPAGTG